MYTLLKNYRMKWQIREANHIQIATDRTVINVKRGRVLKECINGGSYGYWIGKKFILTSKMNDHVEKIANFDIPF
jgi:hypothetical protein